MNAKTSKLLVWFFESGTYSMLKGQMNITLDTASALLQVEQGDKGEHNDNVIDKAEVSATHSAGNKASSKLLWSFWKVLILFGLCTCRLNPYIYSIKKNTQ